ncbi:ATP-binding protein [Actinomadura montaniterrae]|uniref:ATP-binding protein n=1 Tax=Actinomadura montaniterrae TaxID=1803903 RepID=A0A6L3VZD3_9ACTN|nr:ATP-binding protein [Actinomadura montaniterrae]KAB2378999.1 ATP-binding protein [Actinomadura montaniterrae]
MVMTATGDLIIPLLGTPATVGLARTLADAWMCKWDYFHILDDALLIVSELVTNAAYETPHKEIRFQLSRDAQGVIIAVWDSGLGVPRPKPLRKLTLDDLDLSEEAFDDNGGWGLHIVQALATRCGATHDPAGGKWIWARMSVGGGVGQVG